MKTLSVAVIGAGRMGQMHTENIMRYFPQVNLKAIVEHVNDKPWLQDLPIAVISDNVNDVLTDPEIDAIIITTSSSAHVELIEQAAKHRKAIFCEKPIAFTTEAIQQAINAVEQAGVMLQVGYNRRFDPDFIAAKQAVTGQSIGTPHLVSIINRDPKRPNMNFIPRSGGLFLDFAVHDLDMLRFLLNDDIAEVYAQGAALIEPKLAEQGDIDTAVIQVRMTRGTLAVIECSRETGYGYDQRLEIFGDKGSIKVNNNKISQVQTINPQGEHHQLPPYSFVERYQQAYINQFDAFFDAIINNKKTSVDGYDALKAVIAADACRQSMLSQRVRII